jgi:hypothetical protein
MLHQLGLYIHMVALLVVGGGSFGSVIIEKELWKNVQKQSPETPVLLPALLAAKNFITIGILLFLISGLAMLQSVHWIYFTQPWFIAKFILFLMLPLRGLLVAKPLMMQIGFQVRQDTINVSLLLDLKKRMDRFHLIQYALVGTIIFLVLFKI